MPLDTSKLDLGPMSVSVGGTDIGFTKGGVTVSVKETHAVLTADQYGSTALDYVVSGHEYTIKVAVANTKDLTVWAKAFPRAALVTDGTDATKKKLTFTNAVGSRLSDDAVALVLHPYHLAGSDKSGDFTFPKAVAKSATEVKYGPEEQTVIEIEFTALPDANGQFLIMGDSTATA